MGSPDLITRGEPRAVSGNERLYERRNDRLYDRMEWTTEFDYRTGVDQKNAALPQRRAEGGGLKAAG